MIDDALHTLPSVERGGSDTVGPATELEIKIKPGALRPSTLCTGVCRRVVAEACAAEAKRATTALTAVRKKKETPVARSFVFTALDRGFALAV